MQRIIKRFLLRNDRENEKVNQGNFSEIKQDLQMVRFEIQSYSKKAKLDTAKSVKNLHTGMSVLGDELTRKVKSEHFTEKITDFKSFQSDLKEIVDSFDERNLFN
jgi:hypothetical protein